MSEVNKSECQKKKKGWQGATKTGVGKRKRKIESREEAGAKK